jgi:uncharacterized membrane protein YhfC
MMIPKLSIVFMFVSALVSVLLPFLLYFLYRSRLQLRAAPVFWGAGIFVVFVIILESILNRFVLTTSLAKIPWFYVVYGCLAAGIFEECGRSIAFIQLKKKYPDPGTGFAYGIGHGGIESILLAGVTLTVTAIVCIIYNVTGKAALQLFPAATIEAIKTAPSWTYLVSGMERVSAVVIQIALSMLVWSGVNYKGKSYLIVISILIHALIDAPAAMFQIGVISNVMVVEIITLAFAVVLSIATFNLFRKLHKEAEQTAQYRQVGKEPSDTD